MWSDNGAARVATSWLASEASRQHVMPSSQAGMGMCMHAQLDDNNQSAHAWLSLMDRSGEQTEEYYINGCPKAEGAASAPSTTL